MDYKTDSGVIEIFRNLNCIGVKNCFFVTYRNTNIDGMKYGLLGGAVGGAVGGAIAAAAAFSAGAVDGMTQADGILFNATEKGLGMIPLKSTGVQLVANVAKMEPQLEQFVFVPYENIEKLEVKNFNNIKKKVQQVNIKINGCKTLYQLAHVVEKEIPYHESNFAVFMSNHKK